MAIPATHVITPDKFVFRLDAPAYLVPGNIASTLLKLVENVECSPVLRKKMLGEIKGLDSISSTLLKNIGTEDVAKVIRDSTDDHPFNDLLEKMSSFFPLEWLSENKEAFGDGATEILQQKTNHFFRYLAGYVSLMCKFLKFVDR